MRGGEGGRWERGGDRRETLIKKQSLSHRSEVGNC